MVLKAICFNQWRSYLLSWLGTAGPVDCFNRVFDYWSILFLFVVHSQLLHWLGLGPTMQACFGYTTGFNNLYHVKYTGRKQPYKNSNITDTHRKYYPKLCLLFQWWILLHYKLPERQ